MVRRRCISIVMQTAILSICLTLLAKLLLQFRYRRHSQDQAQRFSSTP